MKLIVSQPFGKYAKGDEISDTATVTAVLKSHRKFVVKVATSVSASSATTSTDDTASTETTSTSSTSDTSSTTSSADATTTAS